MMNITLRSQISDQMVSPTFSSIARQPRHEPFSSGIAELGRMTYRVHPRCMLLAAGSDKPRTAGANGIRAKCA